MNLLTDPSALLTQRPKLNYSDYIAGANPIVDAARQRLQGSQQNLMSQNMALQQQQLQMQMQRQQQQQQAKLLRTLRTNLAIAQAQAQQAAAQKYSSVPAGLQRNAQGAYYPGVGAAPAGQIRNWINQALQITGHTGSRHNALVNGLYQMIEHESGGNPNAQNNWDSNAKAGTPSIGLMQTIQPTFNAYALPGHTHIRNPVDNIIAGLRYALRNYGYQMVMGGGRHDSSGHYLGY